MTAGAEQHPAAAEARALGASPKSTALDFVRYGQYGGAVRVRVVDAGKALPVLRPRHDAFAIGGLAMGMPVSGQARREDMVTAAGFKSAVGITSMTLDRGDGTSYAVEEIHCQGPDGVLVLGIDRGAMRPVGPVDPASGIGGPAYSSIVVGDLARSEAFMRDVLRYELRRGFTSAGSKGGLRLPDGTRVVLQQWYAPGALTGYVILLKLLDTPQPTPPGAVRGLAMWSFDVADAAAIEACGRAVAARVIAPAQLTGDHRQTIIAMPDGFPIAFDERGAKP